MAERPSYISQEQLGGPGFSRSIPMPRPSHVGEIIGKGIEQAGKDITQAANTIGAALEAKRQAQADADAMVMFTTQARKADEAIQNLKVDADHETYGKKVLEALDSIGNEGLDKLKDPRAQAAFNKRFLEFHLTSYNAALKWSNQLFHKFQESSLMNYFHDTTHRAAATDTETGYKLISMAVQDAYSMAARNPEMASTIERMTEKFIQGATGRMMRQDAEADPQEFVETGPQRWGDRTLVFTDHKGKEHSVIIGPDPALVTDLHKRSESMARAKENRQAAARKANEKDIEKAMTDFYETWEDQMWEQIRRDPAAGEPDDFQARAAIGVHTLGRERIEKLRDAFQDKALEGVDTPGQLGAAKYQLALGNLDQDGIVGWPGLSSKSRATLMNELKRFRKEDDIVHLPAYKVNLDRVIAEVGGGGVKFLNQFIPMKPEAMEAAYMFFDRAHKPGVSENDLNSIATDVIQVWNPHWKPGKPGKGAPRSEGAAEERVDKARAKVGKAGGSGPGIDDLPRPEVSKQGDVANDANGQAYRFDGFKWKKER